MISKISPVSPNFSGKCKIGNNPQERSRIAGIIKNMPEYNREFFMDSLVFTKKAIEANTPDDKKYVMNVTDYNDENIYKGYCVSIDQVKGRNNTFLAEKPITLVFDGEEMCGNDIDADIKDAFLSLFNRAVGAATTEKPNVPKTKKEILNRLA